MTNVGHLPLIALTAIGLNACSAADDLQEQSRAVSAGMQPATAPPIGAARVPRVTSLPAARAQLRATEGHTTSGVVSVDEAGNGSLTIVAEIANLTPGLHAIHIHEAGDCSADDASSAGAHFAPDGRMHGAPTAADHHAGDLGNIEADERGIAVGELPAAALALTGRHGVVGRAVVVHAQPDDLTSQPNGNSGKAVACGVVQPIGARRNDGATQVE